MGDFDDIRDRLNDKIDQQAAKIERLRASLEKATEKLQIFRSQTDGQYVGGMEYSALMKMIAEAIRS